MTRKRGSRVARKGVVKPQVNSSGEGLEKVPGTIMTYDTPCCVEALWEQGDWSRRMKQWRKSRGIGSIRLSKMLGVSRSYVKHLESELKPWPMRPGIEAKLRALMGEGPAMELGARRVVTLVCRYRVGPRLYIDSAPRRCRGHRRLTVFGSSNQVYCRDGKGSNRECRRLHFRRLRAKMRKGDK